jgi:uncharacterized repeat protein (TIGR01451 family)
MPAKPRIFILLVLAVMLGVFSAPPAALAVPWGSKVDPWVLKTAIQGETEFLVFLEEQADLSAAGTLPTKAEKGRYVFEQLTEVAQRSQQDLLSTLEAMDVAYQPFWIANMVWVRGDQAAIESLATRTDVARIYANPEVLMAEPEPSAPQPGLQYIDSLEWNIKKVRAPEVWEAGYTGEGVVIGGQDTGYEWYHPALKPHYRGWDGNNVDHNFNWHDAIHNSINNWRCYNDSSEPCDDHGHGTHTMGIIVGDDLGHSNQIGMAPDARWIGCRNMNEGVGTPASYSECYQWFLAPTDLAGANPNPDLAPDVINNSWGCPPSEGCTEPEMLQSVIEAVRAAGIFTVHSAGNDGPVCGSINTPAAIYEASFTVGNTTSYDGMAGSSSRGPVWVDGSGRLKPDISAPGTAIRSSIPGGTYTTLSGTSMSAPHVAGLAALLISSQPALRGQVDALEDIIEKSAVPLDNMETCGDTSGDQIPNNIFGWGRIDAWGALEVQTLLLSKTASASRVAPGELITYTLTLQHPSPLEETTGVRLTDAVPENTTFVSASIPYLFDGNTVRWNLEDMNPGESRILELTVRVDLDFTGIIENSDYLAWSNQLSEPVGGEPVLTEVVRWFGVEVTPDYHGATWPGGVVEYVHSLTNTGVNTDTFRLGLASSQGWGTLDREEVLLAPGETVEITVKVNVPFDASPGLVDQTVLTASSMGDARASALVTDTTTVVEELIHVPMVEK